MLGLSSYELFLDFDGEWILAAKGKREGGALVLEDVMEERMEEGMGKKELDEFMGRKGEELVGAHVVGMVESVFLRKYVGEGINRVVDEVQLKGMMEECGIGEGYRVKVVDVVSGKEAMGERIGGKGVLLIGGKGDEIREVQGRVLGLGVYPKSLQLSVVGTLGGVMKYREYKGGKEGVVVVMLGEEQSHIVVVAEGRVELVRSIGYGISSILEGIREGLGLEDIEMVKGLIYSNTFDFKQNGEVILKRLIKEVQTAVDFYEVQSGQKIVYFYWDSLVRKFDWVYEILGGKLGLEVMEVDYEGWLREMGVGVGEKVEIKGKDNRWVRIMMLMGALSVGGGR